jgi:hypothetical protein
VEEQLTFPVPGGLAAELAALTEPMAVGLHAVRRGQVARRRVAVVIGCGPVVAPGTTPDTPWTIELNDRSVRCSPAG